MALFPAPAEIRVAGEITTSTKRLKTLVFGFAGEESMMPAVFSHILRRDRAAAWVLALVLALAAGPALAQTRGSWNVDADGLWSGSSNWLSNTIAGGVSGTATFANNITATRTVTLDTNRSLGAFIFGDADTASAASWIVTGSTMTMNNGTNSALLTVNALGTGATATISTVLASSTSPSIIKNGVGTLVLSATNTFTGKLEITAGTLQVSTDRNLGGTGTFATDRIVISNGATLRTSAAVTMSGNRGITIGSGGGTLSANGGNLTIAARLTGAGNTATVTGSNAVTLQNTSGIATDVNWDFSSNNGIRSFFEGADALGTGSVRVRSGVRLTSQSMTTGTLTNAVTLDDGAGITARSSGGAQTYTNVTLPSAGTLVFNKDDQATAALTIASGKELTGNLTIDTSPGGSNAVGNVTLSGIFSGASGAIIKSGTGTSGRLILTGANTYGGNTTINTGTLQLGNGSTAGSLSTSSVITGSAGATLAFNRSDTITSGVDFNSAIIGGINVAQVGSGTLVLTAANTIGKTSITNGVLQISKANQLGSAPGTFTADQLTISNG
ncbi:MAG: beta strand repeat-containing protein, partial [Planctomycetia bacterium]